MPALQQEGQPSGQYDEAWTANFLATLSEFDTSMNDVMVQSGILAGAPAAAFEEAGAESLNLPSWHQQNKQASMKG